MALSLDLINSRSPYLVKQVNGGYEFTTDSGVRYRIRFLQEDKIGGCDTLHFPPHTRSLGLRDGATTIPSFL